MLNVSTEFRNEMMNDNRSFIPLVDIILKDGTVLHITDKEIWSDSFSIEDATSESGSFKIGALVSVKLSFILNNIYGDYSDYDFSESTATAFISKKLDDGTTEKLQINVFRACDPSYNGSTITIAYYDNSTKLNVPYSKCVQTYPATLGEIAQSACSHCGVLLVSTSFPNSEYIVSTRPDDSAITCADVISFVAQIAGCFAKCDHNGALYFGWYDFKVFGNNMTGGKFDSTASTSYQTGSNFDGGNLTDYASGDTLNGGTFTERQNYLVISNQKSLNVATDNVVITGISVTEDFVETDTEKITTYLSGSDGYVLSITDNPLIQYGKAKIVADFIYAAIGGMTFRPFSAELLSDPTIESGDIAYVSDRKGNLYNTVITYRKFTNGSGTSVSCEAETPERNSEVQYSAATKAVVKARQETDVKLSNYDLAVQQLTTLMSQSFGVFKTEVTQPDGSTIYYMHNKPTLAASAIRWKFTAGALAVSNDYGQTWNAGIDSDGNAVVNVLNAIGVNADWIRGGTLYLGGDNNVSGRCFVEDESGTKLVTLDKNGLSLDPSVKIAWSNVDGATDQVTQITKDTVTTSYVNALNVTAKSVAAENITGTTLSGKTISGGSITIGTKFSVDSSGNLNASSANISGTITADRVITSSGDGVNGSLSYVKDITYTTGMDSFVTHVSSQDGSIRYVSSVGYNTGSVSFQDKNGTYHSFTYLTSISVGYSDATFVKSVSETQSGISFAKEISSVAKGHLNCTNGIIYSIQ